MSGARLCRCGCGRVLTDVRADALYFSAACRTEAYRARKASRSRHAEPSQADRVLAALKRGPVMQSDFDPPTIDGHSRRRRVAARILDLRKAGHAIESARVETSGGAFVAAYRLTQLAVPHIPGGKEAPDGASPPPAPPPCAEQAAAGEPALFDPGAYGRPGLMDAA